MTDSLIIRKQRFRIKTNAEQTALQLRKQVNDELQYSLLHVYDEVLGSLNETNETIFIDKISLDIGRCTKEELRDKLPGMLKQALINYLRNSSKGKGLIEEQFPKTDFKITAAGNTHDEDVALLFFLKNGVYPWWFTGSLFKKPQAIISGMKTPAIENLLINIISAVQINNSLKGKRMLRRFIQTVLFSDYKKILATIISLQSDEQVKRNLELLKAPETINYLSSLAGLSEMQYRKELIQFLMEQSSANEPDILKRFIEFLFEQAVISKSDLLKFEMGNKHIKKPENDIPKLVAEIILQKKERKLFLNKINDHTKIEEVSFSQTNEAVQEIPGEGVYIENGGLVILHPFLQPLFTNLELLQADGLFFSSETKVKAAVVLNYLQGSVSEYEEYKMAFNKVLCGMTVKDVLPSGIELTETEKKECDELLQTVINYWEALKGASPAALQETFLRRKAKLNFKEDHWLLNVERNATDVLLDRLPWGFGIIKLPWLKHLIHVEW